MIRNRFKKTYQCDWKHPYYLLAKTRLNPRQFPLSTYTRKYYAHPDSSDRELALFGTTGFADNHERIPIYKLKDNTGYILVSDQQANQFHVFPREGTSTDPNAHPILKSIKTSTMSSDGSDVSMSRKGFK